VRCCCVSKRWTTLIPGERKKGPNPQGKRKEKQGVCSHYGLAIYIIKKGIFKAKEEELW
jgi:hypothetical protein